MAIAVCALKMMRRSYENKRVMTDSRAALIELRDDAINSRVVVDCLDLLVIVIEHNRVTLKCMPGHQRIDGNITADL